MSNGDAGAEGPTTTDAIEHIGDGYCMGVSSGVLFVVMRKTATLEALRHIRRGTEALIARSTRNVCTLTVLEPSAFEDSLPADVRAEAARIITDMGPRTAATATVFEGTGFRPAAARLVTQGVYLLSRTKFPTKAFGSVKEGAAWLAPHAAITLADAGALGQAVERFRVRLPRL